MKTAELKVLPVSVLKPAEYNPRKKLKPGDREYEKIKASIQEFGFADPLVVNADMTIIGGHQRLTVAMWDENLLADLLQDIQDSDFDLGKTGFDPPEIETLFNKVHDKAVKEDDFDVESELKQPAFSKKGDIWMLGRHKVLCGDSTLPESYQALLGDVKANMVLSDLPYFVAYHGTAGTIQNDDLNDADAYDFTLKAMKCMADVLADDGSIYIFHADTKGLIFRRAFDEAGFYLSGCCIWKKNALVLGRSPYQWMHAVVFRPEADDRLGVRSSEGEQGSPDDEAGGADGLSH